MRASMIIASAVGWGFANAAAIAPRAFQIPNNNGFPNPNAEQEALIAKEAGGKLPGGALPTELPAGSTTAFQLIASNELFETAFFSSLLNNITSKAPGYTELGAMTADAENIIKAVLAQEEQHAIAALAVLNTAKKFAPSACKYQFPVTNLKDAISLAETFTAVVLGALQGANVQFATDGVTDLVRVVSSVIGQEGEQNGAYRLFLEEIPSESPFLTYVPAAFAWSALQLFIVPGSCPFDLKKVDLPIFPGLEVNGDTVASVKAEDQELTFTANLEGTECAKQQKKDGLYITYVTGQQLPYSVPAENVEWKGGVITVKAKFPYAELIAQGFTHASLTTAKDFPNADAIVKATLAAPAVIQVPRSIKSS